MGRVAATSFNKIGVGTSLRIFADSPLEAGIKVPVEFANDDRTSFIVFRVGKGETDIQLPDGSVWRATPHTDDDLPVGISSPGISSQDWVIRSQLAAAKEGVDHRSD